MSFIAQTRDQVVLSAVQYIHTLAIAREGSFTGPRRIETDVHGAAVTKACIGYLVSDISTIESAVFVGDISDVQSSTALGNVGNVESVGGISSCFDNAWEGVTSKTR